MMGGSDSRIARLSGHFVIVIKNYLVDVKDKPKVFVLSFIKKIIIVPNKGIQSAYLLVFFSLIIVTTHINNTCILILVVG